MKTFVLAAVIALWPFTEKRAHCEKDPAKQNVPRCRGVYCDAYKFSKCAMESCCMWVPKDSVS